MKHIKPLILESKQVGTIYHFTSLINTYLIVYYNQLHSNREPDEEFIKTYQKFSKQYGYTYSFTRDKSFDKRVGESQLDTPLTCRIDFDGNKLSTKYRINPFDWNGGGDEMEETIFSTSDILPNMNNYILKLNVCTLESFENEVEVYLGGEPSMLYKLIQVIKQLNIMSDDDADELEYTPEIENISIVNLYNSIIDFIDNKYITEIRK